MRYFELDKNSFSRYLGRNVVFCVEISHPDWTESYNLVNDTRKVTIDGTEYQHSLLILNCLVRQNIRVHKSSFQI